MSVELDANIIQQYLQQLEGEIDLLKSVIKRVHEAEENIQTLEREGNDSSGERRRLDVQKRAHQGEQKRVRDIYDALKNMEKTEREGWSNLPDHLRSNASTLFLQSERLLN